MSAKAPASPTAVAAAGAEGAAPTAVAHVCTLRRCQGIRGCICPRGKIPVGCYGKDSEPKPESNIVEISKKSASSPNKQGLLPGMPPSRGGAREKSVSPVRPRSASQVRVNITSASAAQPKFKAASKSEDEKDSKCSVAVPAQPVTAGGGGVAATSAKAESAAAAPVAAPSGPNGNVMIRYNHYKKTFPVVNGVTQLSAVDGEYSLTFAYPNCRLHISETSPAILAQQDDNSLSTITLLPEDRDGNFLIDNVAVEYWVHIEEDPKERAEYEKRSAAHSKEVAERRAKEEADAENGIIVKPKMESCSCIEGNPCVDRYCCKDWDNRYTVAKKNGWKGFQ